MPKRRKDPEGGRINDALLELSQTASSAVMRELARLLHNRGLSQERVAEALGQNASAVARQFRRKTPRAQTIESYASKFGIPVGYLQLVGGAALAEAQLVKAEKQLSYCLDLAQAYFKPGTVARFWTFFKPLDAGERARLLTMFQVKDYLAQLRDVPESSGWPPGVPWPLQAFADEIASLFDFKSQLRVSGPPADLLSGIWVSAMQYFTLSESRVLIDLAISLLEMKGIPTSGLERHLKNRIEDVMKNPRHYLGRRADLKGTLQ